MELTPKSELGKRLRLRRKARGLSIAEAAFACGWHKSVLSRIELGDRGVQYDDLVKLASALSCSVRDLVPPGRAR